MAKGGSKGSKKKSKAAAAAAPPKRDSLIPKATPGQSLAEKMWRLGAYVGGEGITAVKAVAPEKKQQAAIVVGGTAGACAVFGQAALDEWRIMSGHRLAKPQAPASPASTGDGSPASRGWGSPSTPRGAMEVLSKAERLAKERAVMHEMGESKREAEALGCKAEPPGRYTRLQRQASGGDLESLANESKRERERRILKEVMAWEKSLPEPLEHSTNPKEEPFPWEICEADPPAEARPNSHLPPRSIAHMSSSDEESSTESLALEAGAQGSTQDSAQEETRRQAVGDYREPTSSDVSEDDGSSTGEGDGKGPEFFEFGGHEELWEPAVPPRRLPFALGGESRREAQREAIRNSMEPMAGGEKQESALWQGAGEAALLGGLGDGDGAAPLEGGEVEDELYGYQRKHALLKGIHTHLQDLQGVQQRSAQTIAAAQEREKAWKASYGHQTVQSLLQGSRQQHAQPGDGPGLDQHVPPHCSEEFSTTTSRVVHPGFSAGGVDDLLR